MRDKILNLLLSHDESNCELGLQLIDSQNIDFTDFFSDIRKLYYLEMSSNLRKEMTRLDLLRYLKIETLFLTDVKSESVPDIFHLFKNLDYIDVSYAQGDLNSLFDKISKAPKLETLDIRSGCRDRPNLSRLTEIPESILRIKTLKSLFISDVGLNEIPENIHLLENLESLKLMSGNIKEIPLNLFKLKNLMRLVLSYNNIKEIPKEIDQLNNLFVLYLEGNSLGSLPNSICNLTKLIRLKLNNNKLKKLPNELHKLQNLEILRVSSNVLREIPESIFECKKLRDLSCYNNLIRNAQYKEINNKLKEIRKK
jgi:Leucine-rich repeat (LRR) protein